jgi:hypothetical protein
MPLIKRAYKRLAHDRTMATQPTVAALFTETAKAVSILNGGGAVAMLGLMKALLKNPEHFTGYKWSGLCALASFASGALLVGLTFCARWLLAFWSDVEDAERLRRSLFLATFLLMTASLLAFALGCFFAGLGMVKL